MTQYLILHKVRGEPAFDIAEMMDIPDGEAWWIIPTSGHRAYPYRFWPLTDVTVRDDYMHRSVTNFKPEELPESWPDHYQIAEERAVARKGEGLDIWSIIPRPEPKLNRRRV